MQDNPNGPRPMWVVAGNEQQGYYVVQVWMFYDPEHQRKFIYSPTGIPMYTYMGAQEDIARDVFDSEEKAWQECVRQARRAVRDERARIYEHVFYLKRFKRQLAELEAKVGDVPESIEDSADDE